jgi:hypothetical protein
MISEHSLSFVKCNLKEVLLLSKVSQEEHKCQEMEVLPDPLPDTITSLTIFILLYFLSTFSLIFSMLLIFLPCESIINY